MGSQLITQAPRIAPLLIGGGITSASKTNPEDIKKVLSSMVGNPGISSVLDTLKDEDFRDINVARGRKILEDYGMNPDQAQKVAEELFGEEYDTALDNDEIKDRIRSGGMGEEILGQIEKDKGQTLNMEGVDAEVEEGEVVDESEVEEIKEKLREIDKQRVRDRKESGDYGIEEGKEEFGEEEKLALEKRLGEIIGLGETLDVSDEISMDREYMDEIDPGRFSKRDLYNNEPNERLKQVNPDKKKNGGMIDKAISYPPRN